MLYYCTNKLIINRPPRKLHILHFLSHLSSLNNNKAPQQDAAHLLPLFSNPNWQNNKHLKSLFSHSTPHDAFDIIRLHSHNIDFGQRFFNWVCQNSTYCYTLDGRIHLLYLIVCGKLYALTHKALILLIKECCDSENGILKLMSAIEEMGKVGFRLNYPCYSTLLMGLARLNMGFVAFSVFRRMVADGFVVSSIDYRTVINALCKGGFVEAGEMFLCRVLKLGFSVCTHICTSLVLGYCRVCDLEEALRVFEVMSREDGCRPNSVTYTTLIFGFCEGGRIEEAFRLKEEMSKKGCLPSVHTYTVLIKAMSDRGSSDKALNLFNEMVAKGCKPNVHTYTVLVDGLCREGKIEEANGMFRRMLKDGLCPNTVTFNALINGYCKERKIVSAFELLSLMEKRKCKPNIRTYNELMEGLCRTGSSYKAMLLLRRIIGSGLVPNRVSYNILIDGFCKEGQVDMAFKIYNSMSSFGLEPDCFTFTSIIDGLCKQGKPEQANGLLGTMLKKDISPDEVTFTALLDGYCKIGKIKDAALLFEKMMENKDLKTPHIFNSFLDYLGKENMLQYEQAMFGKLLKYGLLPSVVTYTIIIDGFCQAGKISDSLNAVELMKRSGCLPNVYTYTIIISALCRDGKVREAESFLFSMSDLGVSPNHITYAVLVKAHVDSGRLSRALEFVNTMIRNGCQPGSYIYSLLITGAFLSAKASEAGMIKASSHTDARLLHSEVTNYEFVPNHVFREIGMECIFKLLEEIERCGGSTIELYNVLIMGLYKVGKMDEAYQLTWNVIKLGLFPEKAVRSLIKQYCIQHRYDDCLELIELILSKDFVPSFESFCLVIRGLHSAGQFQKAQLLTSALLKKSNVEDTSLLLPYLQFLIEGDELEECLEILKLIEQVHYKERPVF